MKWYQTKWWYVEGPHFPYILLLGWPFVWVWGAVHDLLDRRRERLWEPVPDGRETLRLWDKDFNLLANWKNGDQLYFTEDGAHVTAGPEISDGPPQVFGEDWFATAPLWGLPEDPFDLSEWLDIIDYNSWPGIRIKTAEDTE